MITNEQIVLFSSFLDSYEKQPFELWERVADIFYTKTFDKGEYLITSGDIDSRIVFILSGGFRHYFIDENANERTTDFCVAGEFTGVVDVFWGKQSPSRDSIVAFEKSETVFTRIEELESLLNSNPSIQSLFCKVIVTYCQIKHERETSLLTTDLEKRYESFLLQYPHLSGRIPQYHIASFLNMTPETLSRIRSSRYNKM